MEDAVQAKHMNQSIALDLAATTAAVAAAGLYSSLCSIQSPNNSPDTVGQSDLVDWSNVSGLTNIPCMLAPHSPGTPPQGDKRYTAQDTATSTEFHLLLDGWFPGILQTQRALVDGTPYEIMSVEADSQKTMTRLAVRRYYL